MPKRVSLAEFSRLYLGARDAAFDEKQGSVRRQAPTISQDGLAEHVFLALAKPADNLPDHSPVLARL
jgi:hypothetical protein